MAFPGSGEHSQKGPTLNISRMYELEYKEKFDKLYTKINFAKKEDYDAPEDILGYLGRSKWQRRAPAKLDLIFAEEFLEIITKDKSKMKTAFLYVRHIDKEGIGTVTKNEMDDIFKTVYEDELKSNNLYTIFEEFQTNSNHLLIDIRKFK